MLFSRTYVVELQHYIASHTNSLIIMGLEGNFSYVAVPDAVAANLAPANVQVLL